VAAPGIDFPGIARDRAISLLTAKQAVTRRYSLFRFSIQIPTMRIQLYNKCIDYNLGIYLHVHINKEQQFSRWKGRESFFSLESQSTLC
jgi:hypothetical protein